MKIHITGMGPPFERQADLCGGCTALLNRGQTNGFAAFLAEGKKLFKPPPEAAKPPTTITGVGPTPAAG